MSRYSRGPRLCIRLSMQPKETKTFCLVETEEAPLQSAGLCAQTGIEGVNDLYWRLEKERKQGACVSVDGLENQFFRIAWQREKGIISIFDKKHGEELADGVYSAFTPIYERTPKRADEDYLFVRRNMGRNRKAFRTLRSVGKLTDAKVLEDGALYASVELTFEMEGAEESALILTAYKWTPKLSVDFRLHKKSVWEPENVYLSLPFAGEENYFDKAGAMIRPRIDQLPGTCMQDKDTGIYYNGMHTIIKDHVRYAGEINKDLYGYNAGSMILADLFLYEITGDESYKKDAVWAAQAAHRAFLKHDAAGRAYYKDFVWFTAIQAEGCDALAQYDADSAAAGRKTLRDSLTFAWEHYKNANGLLPHDYVTGWREGDDDYDRMLLTHSATAEIACLLEM